MVGNRNLRALLVALLCAAALPAPAPASEIRTEQVRFPAGQTGTTIRGTITGRESVAYIVGAEAGQRMEITLSSAHTAIYFNVYEPGSGPGDQALAVGSLTGPMMPDLNRFGGVLPTSGMYTVSVYLYPSAARRGERADYALDISISPMTDLSQPVRNDYADGLQGGPDFWDVSTGSGGPLNLRASPSAGAAVVTRVASGTVLRNLGCRMAEGRRWCQVETVSGGIQRGWAAGDYLRESAHAGGGAAVQLPEKVPVGTPSPDALVPGTEFHATGSIPCARYPGQPMGSCDFGVVRGGNGNGSVTVFWPDGGNRVIFFEDGTPASYDQSGADGGAVMTVGRNADLFTVTIGDQRFEIPEAVITGG